MTVFEDRANSFSLLRTPRSAWNPQKTRVIRRRRVYDTRAGGKEWEKKKDVRAVGRNDCATAVVVVRAHCEEFIRLLSRRRFPITTGKRKKNVKKKKTKQHKTEIYGNMRFNARFTLPPHTIG